MNDATALPSSSAAAGIAQYDSIREPAPTAVELAERRRKSRQMFNRKRGELVDDLLRSLDMLVYAQLSVIYYMDCSFLRFAFRGFIQFLYLTPKPAGLPDYPSEKPLFLNLLGSNLICLILHLWLNAPSAGEATRGYLHGGLAMDFIGQKGPSSKVHLVVLDMLIFTLQLVQLSATTTRRKLKEPPAAASTTAIPSASRSSAQDVDAEERGIRRSQEQDAIELRALRPTSAQPPLPTTSDASELDPRLAATEPRTDANIIDAFNSGQMTIADLDLRRTVVEQTVMHKNPPSDSEGATQQTIRAELMGRLLRMRFARGMQ